MQNNNRLAEISLSIGLIAVVLYTSSCGVAGTPAGPQAERKTYVYVGEAFAPDPSVGPPVGYVAQFRLGSDGTLTALSPAKVASAAVPFFASAVTPSSQSLFIPQGTISEFGIGSDGKLAPNSAPAATGSSIAFAPSGHVAVIPNPANSTLSSYTVSSSGALALVYTVPTGSYPQGAVVDGSGKFAYVANWNDHTVSEYRISSSGVLAPIGSIPTDGYNPRVLAVSPKGFLYCANANSGSLAEFSIDVSTGILALVNSYTIWVRPQDGPLWISFDPSGKYAYVGNSDEVAQFTVNEHSGALTNNGMTEFPNGIQGGAVDPSGRFVFTAGLDGTISQFIISSTGTLIPNGSVSLGPQMVGETIAFAQR